MIMFNDTALGRLGYLVTAGGLTVACIIIEMVMIAYGFVRYGTPTEKNEYYEFGFTKPEELVGIIKSDNCSECSDYDGS